MNNSVFSTDLPDPTNLQVDPLSTQTRLERLTRRDWIAAWIVSLLAAIPRLLISDRRGLWLDEYYTLRAAEMNWGAMVRDRLAAGHSPLYFLYAKLGLFLGSEEWMLRLTSVLALSATVLLVTGLIGALRLRRILPVFWILAILHPYWITIGSEYRYMMPVVAVTAAAGWAAIRYTQDWRMGRGLVLALFLGTLLCLHGSAEFIAAAFLLYLLWEARAHAGRWKLGVFMKCWPVLAGVLASMPIFILICHSGGSEEIKAEIASIESFIRDMCEVAFARSDFWANVLGVQGYLFYLPQAIALILALALARRELLVQRNATARRFLTALLVGTPLAQIMVATVMRQVQGPARYLAAYSIPLAICIAIAWNASSVSPLRRGLFRALLGLILVTQAVAAALDRGDYQREAIQWIMAQDAGQEKILVSSATINSFAFQYLGFSHPKLFVGLNLSKRRRKPERVKQEMQKIFHHQSRGFILLYHDRANILRDVTKQEKKEPILVELEKEGFILADRHWRLGECTTVVALIRDASQRSWLDALPPPPTFWGPATGALKPKEKLMDRKQ